MCIQVFHDFITVIIIEPVFQVTEQLSNNMIKG